MVIDETKQAPEEVKVTEIIDKATERINEIDNRIANPDQYMRPAYKPKFMGPSTPTVSDREHFKKTQEFYRKELKEQTRNEAAKVVEKSPLDVQLRTFAQVDNWAEQHTTEKERAEERQGLGKNDLSKSQDVSMKLLHEEKTDEPGVGAHRPGYLKTPGNGGPSEPGGGKEDKGFTPERRDPKPVQLVANLPYRFKTLLFQLCDKRLHFPGKLVGRFPVPLR